MRASGSIPPAGRVHRAGAHDSNEMPRGLMNRPARSNRRRAGARRRHARAAHRELAILGPAPRARFVRDVLRPRFAARRHDESIMKRHRPRRCVLPHIATLARREHRLASRARRANPERE
ncbi:hypothetical protein F01_440074 [Burkholderia cenocepacia]|nr:hypothetical protein F01_440074 [Burkholderia cenocepacia]